jgi:signal transduction histidine kinase/CheY-like chemotaxis protein
MNIRRRLLLLVFSVWLPASAGFALLAWYTYEEETAATRREVEQYGRSISSLIERELDKRVVLANSLASSNEARNGDFAQFHSEARIATARTEDWALIVDADWQLLNTRAAFPFERVKRAKPGPLAEHEASIVFVPFAPVARTAAITVFVPVPGASPQNYNVGLSFEPEVLQDILGSNPGPFNALTSVVNNDHVMMARSRDSKRWFGKPLTRPFQQRINDRGIGFASSTTLDGVRSMTYLNPPSRYGWSVIVSVPMTELAGVAQRATAKALSAATLLFLIGMGFAVQGTRRIARTVSALQQSAQQLGSNQVPEPLHTGVDEVDAVADALHVAGLKAKASNHNLERRVEEAVRNTEEAHAKLLQVQKMEIVGRLTAGVAHDFNNLLQTIGSSQTLLSRRLSGEQERRLLDNGMRAVSKAGDLVKQLMVFGRVNRLEPTTVSVEDTVLRIEELTRAALGERISLASTLQPGLPFVHVDPIQLEMALLNLVFNARDALPTGGAITIGARLATSDEVPTLGSGTFVRVEVVDNGTGMSTEVLARASELYFTTKPVGVGSGIGLAQVHSFVQQSGGTLQIDSELGRGTRVCMHLPAAKSDAPFPSASSAVEKTQSRTAMKLLLVEDDTLVSTVITNALQDEGYQVRPCSNADDALELLQGGEHFDILFTDVMMPGKLNGADLARWCAAKRPTLPVVITTGYAENLSELPYPVLRKPYDIEVLFAALEKAYRGS